MNLKGALLVVGLIVGGLIGWFTAPPPAAQVQIGPVSVEVHEGTGDGGSVTATGEDGQIRIEVGERSFLDDRNARTAVFAVIAAIAGFGIGAYLDRRKT
jgi:hypothetical protein